jgi:preprotein translocase subunit YajC
VGRVDYQTSILLAVNEPEQPAPPRPPAFLDPLVLFPGIALLFYFFVLRPGRRQDLERQSFLSNLKKNDKVVTVSGIYGTVVAVAEKEDEVTVRVDDNVRLKMTKASIVRNLTNEEAAKAAKTTAQPTKEGGA